MDSSWLGSPLVMLCGSLMLACTAFPAAAQSTPAPSATSSSPTVPGGKPVSPRRKKTDGVEQVRVLGARSPLRQEIDSPNQVSVVDRRFMETHPDTNVAETLARLPGVSVMPTSVGGSIGGTAAMINNAARGEGQFLSVRGIGPDYTLNMIDGVNVASAKPASRQIQLSLLPALGFADVVVSKTGQAADPGEWIAGFINFQTPSAFEVGHDLTSLKLRSDFTQTGYDAGTYRGPFNGGGVAQGEVSRIFGPGRQFGVHLLGYYQSRNFTSRTSNQNEGNWDFIRSTDGSDHSPIPGISPTDNLTTEQINPEVDYGNEERYGGNAALDWHGDHISLFARGSYAASNVNQITLQRGLQSTSQNWVPGSDVIYTIQEAGVVGSYYATSSPEQQSLSTFQTGARFDKGPVELTVTGFGSYASDDQQINSAAYKNFDLDPSGDTLLLDPAYRGDPAIPIQALTPEQAGSFADLSQYVPQTNANFGSPGMERTLYKNNQALGGAKADMALSTGWRYLPTIALGAKYYGSSRNATNRDYSYDDPDGTLPGLAPTLSQSRLFDRSIDNSPSMSGVALARAVSGLPLSAASAAYGGPWTGPDAVATYNANVNTQSAQEHVSAAYVALPFEFGDFHATPGLRYEYTDISNRYWNAESTPDGDPSDAGGFQTTKSHFSEFLPSLFLTYRPNRNAVYRASFDTSYVRPNTFLLGGARIVTALGDNMFQIQEGNPALRPVVARNFDLGGQWQLPDGSELQVTGFYKRLSNYLFDAGSSTRSDGTHYISSNSSAQVAPNVVVIRPRNGGDADAYGLEIAASKRLGFLPGALRNLTLSGNVTLQQTHVDLGLPGIADGGPIQYAPDWMFNLSLAYTVKRFTTNLSFRRSGRFLETYYTYSAGPGRTVDLSWWDQPTQRLDWFASYDLSKSLNVAVSAQNLLNDTSYYATRGKYSTRVDQVVFPGRTFFLSIGTTY